MEALQNEPRGLEMDMALNEAEWLADALHRDIDRLTELTDFVAEPLEEPADEPNGDGA